MSLIPIIAALWVALKSGIEIYGNIYYASHGRFVEDSPAHTNQHIAVGLMMFVYGITVPLMIIWGGFEFSIEWIPLNLMVVIMILYVNEHFAIEREQREDVIYFKDLFCIKFPKKIKIENHG